MQHHAFTVAGFGPDLDLDVGPYPGNAQRGVKQVDLEDLAGHHHLIFTRESELDDGRIHEAPHQDLDPTPQDQRVCMSGLTAQNRIDFIECLLVGLLIHQDLGTSIVDLTACTGELDAQQLVQLLERGAKIL